MTVYLSSAYLAPVEYYTKLLAYGQVYIEQHDHYTKQTYRNRCTIAAPDGALALSIQARHFKMPDARYPHLRPWQLAPFTLECH